MSNLTRMRKRMHEHSVGAMLVSDITNVQWLTNFSGSSGVAVVTADIAQFITDSRYSIQASIEVNEFDLVIFQAPRKQNDVFKETLESLNITEIGFEPSTSYSQWETWSQAFAPIKLTAQGDILPPLRMIKTPDEIEKIEAACKLADNCFTHLQSKIKAGVSEMDLAIEIEFFFRKHNATIAFDVISASGPNSAKPHGRATERLLEVGDFLTLDFGAKLDGYNSDITRTVCIGEPSPRHREIYDAVLESQLAAIDALKPGANGRDVDAIAREVLAKKDLAKYFGHGLGHGLGRSVHDYGGLSPTAAICNIEPGQVWTIEPGVYIDGFGGVRIEDDVVVTETGNRVLTTSPKELLVMA